MSVSRALLLLLALPLCAQQQFQLSPQPKQFPSSPGFRGVAVADFNNDGKPDLAFADMFVNGVSILLNDGAGNFTQGPSGPFPVKTSPFLVVAADFNNDGNMDIAVLNHFTDPVLFRHSAYAIYFGDGTGRFTPGPVQVTSTIAYSMITGDFNNDGKADLAIGEDDGVTALLGQGDGTFLLAENLFGTSASFLLSADFNKDGLPDIALFSSAPASSFLYLGTGYGRTVPGPAIPMSTSVTAVTGDWNNDGIPDLATFNNSGMNALLGDGKGTFRVTSSLPGSYGVISNAVADFDGDGNLDIVASTMNGPVLLAGDGTGKFRATPVLSSLGPINFYSVIDVNSDGKPDIIGSDGTVILNTLPKLPFHPHAIQFRAVPGQTSVPSLPIATGQLPSLNAIPDQPWVHFNAGRVTVDASSLKSGVYQANIHFTAPGYFGTVAHVTLNVAAPSSALTKAFTIPLSDQGRSVNPPTLADFNGDGSPDFLVLTLSSQALSLSLNDGHGNFGPTKKFPLLSTNFGLGKTAVADFNADGNLDVLVVTGPLIVAYFGDGKGNLSRGRPANISLTQGGFSVATADFNGDGFADLLVDGQTGQPAQIFLGDGTGDFSTVTAPVSGSRLDFTGYRFQIADFNGDAIPDLAFSASSGHAVYLALGDGTGHFQITQTVLLTSVDRLITLTMGDFNNDGLNDLVAVSGSSGSSPGLLTALLNDGTGKFTQLSQPITAVQGTENIAAADFDGDGNLDLAIGTDGNTTTLLFGDGRGVFSPRSGYVLHNTFYLLAADINADGRQDLLALSTISGEGEDVYLGALALPTFQLTQEPDNPFTFRQSIAIDLTITPLPLSFVPFTGNVSVFDGATLLGTVPLTATTSRFTALFSAGTHQFRAVYNGQTTVTLTVVEAGTPATIGLVVDPLTGMTIGVSVNDAQGDPVSGAGVIFTAPAFGPSLIRTNSSGLATAPIFPPGTYSVTATVSGYPALVLSYQVRN